MLVQHYLRRFSRELGREVREVAPEAMERLRSYSWPGNIRELQSVLKQALLQASGTVLLPAFLPELAGRAQWARPGVAAARELIPAWRRSSASGSGPARTTCTPKRTASWTGSCLPACWSTHDGNQHQAARLLGIARQDPAHQTPPTGVEPHAPADADDDDQP